MNKITKMKELLNELRTNRDNLIISNIKNSSKSNEEIIKKLDRKIINLALKLELINHNLDPRINFPRSHE